MKRILSYTKFQLTIAGKTLPCDIVNVEDPGAEADEVVDGIAIDAGSREVTMELSVPGLSMLNAFCEPIHDPRTVRDLECGWF